MPAKGTEFNMRTNVVSVIEIAAITLTLLFVAWQTKLMSDSMIEIKKELRFNATMVLRDNLKSVNHILLSEEDLRQEFGLTKKEVLATMIIAEFEKIYLLRQEGFIEDEYWESQENLIDHTMKRDWIREVWQNQPGRNSELHPSFVRYVNKLLGI